MDTRICFSPPRLNLKYFRSLLLNFLSISDASSGLKKFWINCAVFTLISIRAVWQKSCWPPFLNGIFFTFYFSNVNACILSYFEQILNWEISFIEVFFFFFFILVMWVFLWNENTYFCGNSETINWIFFADYDCLGWEEVWLIFIRKILRGKYFLRGPSVPSFCTNGSEKPGGGALPKNMWRVCAATLTPIFKPSVTEWPPFYFSHFALT